MEGLRDHAISKENDATPTQFILQDNDMRFFFEPIRILYVIISTDTYQDSHVFLLTHAPLIRALGIHRNF